MSATMTTVEVKKLPCEPLRFFSKFEEADAYAARFSEPVYYVAENNTYYVVDHGR